MTTIYKVSGNDLDDTAFSARLCAVVAAQANAGAKPILVHGGGKEIDQLLNVFNITPQKIDGLRVTDAKTRDIALMVLSGLANKRLVAGLIHQHANAVGLSGVDGALVRVQRLSAALGFVGKPVSINTALLEQLLAASMVPVVNPMSLDDDDDICNVNADHVAGAIAAALNARLLTFISNVPGVLDAHKMLVPCLSASQAEALITDGTIHSGMIPKVRTCLEALQAGVRRVRITNLDGAMSDLGTVFENESE